ncbi:hypothetical protein EPYR_01297 [Erwinia pyrifoliae DSM 12163]|nr:hypothetical protein EJP617_34720 [Erwinia sp. Ejp617]CAY73677.1 hypothetical protein EPYR_01297 [Erwinia pyrifoliae DSM 12163]
MRLAINQRNDEINCVKRREYFAILYLSPGGIVIIVNYSFAPVRPGR